MSQADVIQVDYEALADIAARFGKAARAHEADLKRIDRAQWALIDSWHGQAATSFFWELTGDVMPGFRRLISALDEAERITLEIGRTFREAEEEAARLFTGDAPICFPSNGVELSEPTPTLPDLFRAVLEAFQTIIGFPKAVVIFIEQLSRGLTSESERLLKDFYDWVDMWGDNPARAARIGLRWGRKIPEIGDLFTVWSGVIDVGETWWHGRHEYTQGTASRGMAAMTVDATLAFLPAATELIGGAIGGAVGLQTGIWVGGLLGLGGGSSSGPGGTATGVGTGAIVVGAGFMALGDWKGGEWGREFGEHVVSWARSEGRRERATDAVETILIAGGFVSPYARWDWSSKRERNSQSLGSLDFSF